MDELLLAIETDSIYDMDEYVEGCQRLAAEVRRLRRNDFKDVYSEGMLMGQTISNKVIAAMQERIKELEHENELLRLERARTANHG
jgi:hypothetical protein